MSEVQTIRKQQTLDIAFKYILVGNTSSGKTCLLHYFLESKPKSNSTFTIGVEFGSKFQMVGTSCVRIQVWDTAGQERFRSVTRTYYRGAVGAIVVFDLTNIDSFHSVTNWISDVRELADKEVCILVCGNKSDLVEERVVSKDEASRLCSSLGVNYCEASALTGKKVHEGFDVLTNQLLDKLNNHQIDPVLQPKPFLGRRIDSFDIDKPKRCYQC